MAKTPAQSARAILHIIVSGGTKANESICHEIESVRRKSQVEAYRKEYARQAPKSSSVIGHERISVDVATLSRGLADKKLREL